MATDYSHYDKYGRLPRVPVKIRWCRLATAFLFLILLLLSYSAVRNDHLQDQPTKEEKRIKIQKERDEAAALSLFDIPSKKVVQK